MYKLKILTIFCFIFLFMLVGTATAGNVTLAWDPVQASDLAGYRIYYDTDMSGEPYNGTGAVQGPSAVEIPLSSLVDVTNPEFTLEGLDTSKTYYFVATAYDDLNLESKYSNEVRADFPPGVPQNLTITITITITQ